MIAADMEIEKERMMSKSRNRKVAVARKKLIYEAIEKGGLKQVEIAKRLHMDQSAVSRFYSEFIKSKSYVQA
jgi:predicted transcriptional regulator